jgi:phosphatidylserine decarboxylase
MSETTAVAGAPETEATPMDRLFVRLVSWLPTRWLSSMMFKIARIKNPDFKNWLIRTFLKRFPADLEEAEYARIENYDSFNHFFTRELKPGMRPVDPSPRAMVSPVDGVVSQCGEIRAGLLYQAKGHDYSLMHLLNGDEDIAQRFANGGFCTIYLAPFNYHRVHMPLTGRLHHWWYIPGRLFSVNGATARALPNLFTRNERICAIFETDVGPVAMIMVGALFVGSMETVWAGQVTPPHVRHGGGQRYEPMTPVTLGKGVEMGRFNMGSTVILLTPPDTVGWNASLAPGTAVRVGEAIARMSPSGEITKVLPRTGQTGGKTKRR